MQHQDTARFTETERSLMANAMRAQATHLRLEVRDYTVHHRRNLDTDVREVRLMRADTLRRLADEFEMGERR